MEEIQCEDSMHLAYNVYGEEKENVSSPVVIFHGLFDNKENWKDVATSISNKLRRKVYVIDIRNHGDSPKSSNISHEDNVNDLEKFVQLLDQPVVLIGHHIGGLAAMDLSFRKPHLIDELILIEASPLRCSDQEATRNCYITFHMFRLLLSAQKSNCLRKAKIFFEDYLTEKIESVGLRRLILSNMREDIFGVNWKVNLKQIELDTVLNKSFDKVYPLSGTFEGETLFIHCNSSDIIKPADYENLKKQFPQMNVSSIKNCSIWIHLEQPDELVKTIVHQISKN